MIFFYKEQLSELISKDKSGDLIFEEVEVDDDEDDEEFDGDDEDFEFKATIRNLRRNSVEVY